MNTDSKHIELGEVEFVEDVYEQGEPPVPVHPLYDGEAPEPVPTVKSE